jgi:hypothetical protein
VSALVLPTVVLGALAAASGVAHAAPRETATLTYASAPGCPDEAAFRQRVAVRLGYDPFVETATRAIDVKVTSSGKRLTATTRLRTPGKNDSTRKLDETPDHCEALTDAVAASAATVIDPVRANGGTPAPARTGPEEVVKVEAGSAASVTRLRIESDRPDNELVRHIGTSYGTGSVNGKSVSLTEIHLERVCRLPCTADVPTESTYYVDGPGMAGRSFAIPPNTKQMSAHVKGADGWPLVLALYGGVGGGGAAFLTGGLLWAINGSDSYAALTVVGGLVLVGGIAALVMLPKTHVESADGTRLDANAKPAPAKPHLTLSGLVF